MGGPISTPTTQSANQSAPAVHPARNFADQDQFQAAKSVQVSLVCCMQVEQLKDLNTKLAEIRAAGIHADPDTIKFVQDRLSKLLTEPPPYLIGADQQNWLREVTSVVAVAATDAKLLMLTDNFASQLAAKMSLPMPVGVLSPSLPISGVVNGVNAEVPRTQLATSVSNVQPATQAVVQTTQVVSVASIGRVDSPQRPSQETLFQRAEGAREAAKEVAKEAIKEVRLREEIAARQVTAAVSVATTTSIQDGGSRTTTSQLIRTPDAQSVSNQGLLEKKSGAVTTTTELRTTSRVTQSENSKGRDEALTQRRVEEVRPGGALAARGGARAQEAVVYTTNNSQAASQQGLGNTGRSTSATATPSSSGSIDTQSSRPLRSSPSDRSARPQASEPRTATVEALQRVIPKAQAASPQRETVVRETRAVRPGVADTTARMRDSRRLEGSPAATTTRYNHTVKNQGIAVPPLRSLPPRSVLQPQSRRIAREGTTPNELSRRPGNELRIGQERIQPGVTATPLHARQLHLQSVLRALRAQGIQENSRGIKSRDAQHRDEARRLKQPLAVSEKATKLLQKYSDLPVKELVRLNLLRRDQKQKPLSPSERLAQRQVRMYLQQLRSILAQLLAPNSLLYKRVTSELSIADLELLVELLAGRKARRALRKKVGQGVGGEIASEDLTSTVLESLATEEGGTPQASATPQSSATEGPNEGVEGGSDQEALNSGQFVADGATPKANLTTVMMKDDSSLPTSNG